MTTRSSTAITEPPPFPLTIRSFLKSERNINDDVQEVFVALVNNPATAESFRALLHAIYNSQAKEGSMIADDFEAARMIRENAVELNRPELANENLTTIKQALGVVTRRCRADRTSRREQSRRNQEQQFSTAASDSNDEGSDESQE